MAMSPTDRKSAIAEAVRLIKVAEEDGGWPAAIAAQAAVDRADQAVADSEDELRAREIELARREAAANAEMARLDAEMAEVVRFTAELESVTDPAEKVELVWQARQWLAERERRRARQ